MEDRGPFRPRSKLIVIKEGMPEETKRKAFESYLTLTGSTELMRTAWECGLGEENSMGFGMVEVVGAYERRAFGNAQDKLQAWSEFSRMSRRENREL